MNFKYLIFLCLMFIVSMGAVSAADDVNSTFNANIDVNDVPVDSVIIDNPIYTNNAKEYTITNDNYGIILIMKLVMHWKRLLLIMEIF